MQSTKVENRCVACVQGGVLLALSAVVMTSARKKPKDPANFLLKEEQSGARESFPAVRKRVRDLVPAVVQIRIQAGSHQDATSASQNPPYIIGWYVVSKNVAGNISSRTYSSSDRTT